ncbi:hypothetical protein HYH03_003118 [Edaphochlamys debaryana]|uniref:Pyrimidine 5-nucleotidase n=1 Tax=Edaphochlamys debaryana TaxID=47281 RepID=A0A836C4I2_9CHLO|nr:hypothetical protein HYH03_003118 [Edaphochlamys debaryana]|eukprot:KAG2498928.1 hypothetical protein HYH03_003118 [Edaphochlamys debaryana]
MTVGSGIPGKHQGGLKVPKVLLFDLDDTLYRCHKIPAIVKERISAYMLQKLGYKAEEVAAKTTELYLSHGTTLAGLVASGHKIDFDDWHEFVHQGALDYDTLLHPDPSLRDILCSIDLPKYILTNANRVHTELCLKRLGISDCFQGMFYFENVMEMAPQHGIDVTHSVLCKPDPRTYTVVCELLGVAAHDVLFFDDSIRNVASAHSLGMMTVLVGVPPEKSGTRGEGYDLALPTLHQLPDALPALLDQPGLVHDDSLHHLHAGPGETLATAASGSQPSVVAVPAS